MLVTDRSLTLVKMSRILIPKNAQGMSTFEVIIVLVIVGVLAAVSIPNLDKAMKRSELNTAVDEVQGIITEAISYAARSSDSCFIRLDNAYGATLEHKSLSPSDPRDPLNECIVSPRTIPSHVRVVPVPLVEPPTSYVDVGVNISGAVDYINDIVIQSSEISDQPCLTVTLIGSVIQGKYDSGTNTCIPD